MITETISYRYSAPSSLKKKTDGESLFLSKYSEVEKQQGISCYFWGRLNQAQLMAQSLISLSNVVQSSFNLSTVELAHLKDPIATASNGQLRFEGFSYCTGVYAQVDFLPESLDGEFLANGSTNVDFNQEMISALGSIRAQEKLVLSIGEKEVGLHRNQESIIERKVPLPTKWIKSLASVQIYLSHSNQVFSFSPLQAQQLIRSIPKQKVRSDYYLTLRGNSPQFSPIASTQGICIGGLHRLRLLEGLLPYIDSMQVYANKEGQTTTWQLKLGAILFTLTLSRDSFRGFSGEGAVLDYLSIPVEENWIQLLDNYAYTQGFFNAQQFAKEAHIPQDQSEHISARLASLGLLGYDLHSQGFYYRQLPFKLNRLLSLNPRLKGAQTLLENQSVSIISQSGGRIEAKVQGTGVWHTVLIEGDQARCTCPWYSKYQGQRGICKHVLAVKQLINNPL